MKKAIVLVLALVMLVSLVGCGASGSVKTGVGVVTSTMKSKAATAEAAGTAQVDSVIAAVTIDKDGKILTADIDSAQTKIGFDAAGQLTAEGSSDVPTKTDLGADYGMKKASGIGMEWDEQIVELEKWLVGKTADQVSGMALNEGKATDADLTSKVTITVTDYQKAVREAIANAK
jgi:hypothetical protein